MKNNNLSVSKKQSRLFASESRTGHTSFSIEEDQFIKDNYLMFPIKTLGKKINRSGVGVLGRMGKMGLKIPKEIIEKRKQESYYKKGHTPSNKGKKLEDFMSEENIKKFRNNQYKKGHLPHNSVGIKDGDIRIRVDHKNHNGRKYKWIRISLGHWVMLQRFNWELLYGPIPEGAIIRFIKDDTMNCNPSNLMLIDKQTNMNLNTIHRYPDELKQLIRLKNKLFKTIQKNDNRS